MPSAIPRGYACMRVRVLLLLVPLCLPLCARAQTAGEFLRLGFGARALALGNSMLSAEGDPASLYWNPALLARAARSGAEFMHTENFGGAAGFDAAAVLLPLKGGGKGEAIGIGVLRLSVDDIPTTSNFQFDDVGADGLPGTHDAGEGNGRWDPGEPVHADPSKVEFRSDQEWAVLAGYARPLGERGAVGVTAKLIRQSLAGRQSNGAGLDAGASLQLPGGVDLAARVSDLTATRITWDNGLRETIAPQLHLAVARTSPLGTSSSVRLSLGGATSSWDLVRSGREWHGGLEYSFRDRLFLRAGDASGGASFGAGLGFARFRVDYAAAPFHDLGATHRLSALARW